MQIMIKRNERYGDCFLSMFVAKLNALSHAVNYFPVFTLLQAIDQCGNICGQTVYCVVHVWMKDCAWCGCANESKGIYKQC